MGDSGVSEEGMMGTLEVYLRISRYIGLYFGVGEMSVA